MILPFLLAALAFVTLLAVLAPLLRGTRPNAERATYDQAVYRDQLQELDRDIARGLLTSEEAAAARLEIQRRILASDRLVSHRAIARSSVANVAEAAAMDAAPPHASHQGVAPIDPAPSTQSRSATASVRSAIAPVRLARSPVLAALLFIAIAAGSVGLYLRLGAPDVPGEPFATRQAELAATEDQNRLTMQQASDQLAAKLKANPADPQGWMLYGRSLAMLNQWDQAEEAYRHAIALGASGPEVTADHAEMLVLAAGGTVTPAAEAAFQQLLNSDPGNGTARYYLAIAAMQAGEPHRAIDMLQGLLADMPAASPLREQIGSRIAEAAQAAHVPVPELAKGTAPVPGPDADAVASAAGMPDQQRQAMIQNMVSRLAAKQQADPTNLNGWLELGRAYTVLNQSDQAADAFEQAARLKPGDVSIPLQEVRALLAEHKPTDPLPPRIIDLLKRVEASDPQQPIVLWYLGIAAVQGQEPDQARHYWGILLTKLPPSSDDARMVQSALDALSSPGFLKGSSPQASPPRPRVNNLGG